MHLEDIVFTYYSGGEQKLYPTANLNLPMLTTPVRLIFMLEQCGIFQELQV